MQIFDELLPEVRTIGAISEKTLNFAPCSALAPANSRLWPFLFCRRIIFFHSSRILPVLTDRNDCPA
jgi:hypothetical protein